VGFNLPYVVISGFRRDVHEICALMGYYAAWNGNFLPTFRDKLWAKKTEGSLTLEDGARRLFRQVGIELTLYAG
jgi:hypothetical protein